MPFALNNTPTVNAYSAGTTLECPRCVRLNFDVSNAAIFYQLGLNVNVHKADPNEIAALLGQPSQYVGNIIYGTEIFTIPKSFTLSRAVDSVRIRSGVAGVPAQVTVSAWQVGELIGP